MSFRLSFLPLFLLIFGCTHTESKRENSFFQKTATQIVLPAEAGEQILKLFLSDSLPVVITPKGVFTLENNSWNVQLSATPLNGATIDEEGIIWVVTDKEVNSLDKRTEIPLPSGVEGKDILCILWENSTQLLVGTGEGLYSWSDQWSKLTPIAGIRVNDLTKDADGTLWAATSNGLWKREKQEWVNLDETLMAIGNAGQYFALATQNKGGDLIFGAPLSIGCIAQNGDHWALRGPDGLPYGPATVIRSIGNDLWIGTDKGAIQKDSAWHYYHGKRWLPAEQVTDILEVSAGKVWVATTGGISEISRIEMSLSEKAAYFEDLIDKRHNRRGLINISKLAVPGDLSTSYTENEDNDGLWTSCYLAAECFRFAATQDPVARERAVRTFEALERLETITGIPGYPARSYATAADTIVQSKSPHPKYWHFSPDGQWQWLDDTSSDEITGHLFTLSLFYELVADDSQKQRVVDLIDRIMTHIIDNDFHLIDPDGKPTRWGVWHPDSLNHAPNWLYEKGLNSLQILSHLKTASHFTGNPKYDQVYENLINEHGYAQNAVNAKIFGPYETSHSDDILNFFPYYGLLNYTPGSDTNYPSYVKSLERSWKAVRSDRMPVWNVIASALLKRDCDLDIAREELEQYPLDQVDWAMENSHRWDILKDPLVDRSARAQAMKPIPSAEASVSRWNTNPKRLDSGRRGETEEAGTYYLFAYWMGRYYGFF